MLQELVGGSFCPYLFLAILCSATQEKVSAMFNYVIILWNAIMHDWPSFPFQIRNERA